jgi:CheY-like chemotaxis protein
VRVAHDYAGALAALAGRRPQVVVSDIGLPGRDGYELVRAIREQEAGGADAGAAAGAGRLPVIALTAFARAEDRHKTLEAGFDRHLGKPLKPHLLVQAIAELLGR